MLCTTCGFNQRTGAKIQTHVLKGAPGVLPYKSSGTYTPPSDFRMKAGRICIVLSVLMYLGGTCLGIATVAVFVMANSAKIAAHRPGAAAIAGIAFLVGTLFVLGVATTYLMCGLSIRRGGLAAVIIALIVGGLHGLLALANFAFGRSRLPRAMEAFSASGFRCSLSPHWGNLPLPDPYPPWKGGSRRGEERKLPDQGECRNIGGTPDVMPFLHLLPPSRRLPQQHPRT